MRTVEYRSHISYPEPMWGVVEGNKFYPFGKKSAEEVAKSDKSLYGCVGFPLNETAKIEEPE